jgi:hypothetical protein
MSLRTKIPLFLLAACIHLQSKGQVSQPTEGIIIMKMLKNSPMECFFIPRKINPGLSLAENLQQINPDTDTAFYIFFHIGFRQDSFLRKAIDAVAACHPDSILADNKKERSAIYRIKILPVAISFKENERFGDGTGEKPVCCRHSITLNGKQLLKYFYCDWFKRGLPFKMTALPVRDK